MREIKNPGMLLKWKCAKIKPRENKVNHSTQRSSISSGLLAITLNAHVTCQGTLDMGGLRISLTTRII